MRGGHDDEYLGLLLRVRPRDRGRSLLAEASLSLTPRQRVCAFLLGHPPFTPPAFLGDSALFFMDLQVTVSAECIPLISSPTGSEVLRFLKQ